MCGICFIYDNNGVSAYTKHIGRMVQSLAHRGPDEQKQLIRGRAALGHTRLSIVDIHAGAQPMVSEDKRYSIIFNGEIYNYKELRNELAQNYTFHTQSDTEVILNLYLRDKERCVNKLRGMFAFAIHDSLTEQMFVARDRLGIKPLNYHWDGRRLIAGSEIKSIFASGLVEPEFNHQSLRNFFKYQFNITPYTPFRGIYELPPGHVMHIAPDGEPDIRQYWDWQFPRDGEYDSSTEQQWTDKFESALEDAVLTHTIGEVPIGAYLSGGVDSSTTTYLLKDKYPHPLKAYTIRFSNTANDEYPITKNTADVLGVELFDLYMDDNRAGGYMSALEQAAYFVEQPQRMALDIPLMLLSQFVQQQQYKVIYSGEGADEILGGYDCYRQDYIRVWGNEKNTDEERLQYYLQEFGNDFAENHLRMLANLHQTERQQQTVTKYGCYPAWHDYWHIMDDSLDGVFSEQFITRSDGHERQMERLIAQIKPRIEGLHPLNQSLYMEGKTRLPGWILLRGDHLAMANGVEARVPFLDHRLVELTAQIPPGLKLNGLDEKYILRKLMLPKLPAHPQNFKKRAFYTPIREWFFSAQHADQLDKYLSADALQDAGLFNVNTIQQKLDQLLACNSPDNIDEYWRMMKLEWVLYLVLNIQVLHDLFINRNAPCFDFRK